MLCDVARGVTDGVNLASILCFSQALYLHRVVRGISNLIARLMQYTKQKAAVHVDGGHDGFHVYFYRRFTCAVALPCNVIALFMACPAFGPAAFPFFPMSDIASTSSSSAFWLLRNSWSSKRSAGE